MVEKFTDVNDFFKNKSLELIVLNNSIKSNNKNNVGTLKEELIELPHQFFEIENPKAIIFNLKNFSTVPFWFVGEIISEFLNINPPIMARYRKDLIENTYKLMNDGTLEYMYGSRWKEFNQIDNVVKKLRENPTSKRCLITTWVPYDTELTRSDVPCNINYMFLPRDGKLDMTATIRSNDIMRGTKYDYPLASFMQQSIASLSGLELGKLYFLVNSLHVYSKDLEELKKASEELFIYKKDLPQLLNDNPPISLELPSNMNEQNYWHDMRHIKKAEEASYNGSFSYCDKHIYDINYPIFRDFARILGVRNAKVDKNKHYGEKFFNELESLEMKKWLK